MKYSYKFIKGYFLARGYILITKENEIPRLTTTDKLKYICPKHKDKGILEISFSKLMNGRGCKYCGREQAAQKRRTDDEVINKKCERLAKSRNFIYKGFERIEDNGILYIYIKFICPKHINYGVQYMRKTNMARDIKGCKYCASKQIPVYDILDKIYALHPTITIMSEYKGISEPITYKCSKHNHYSTTTPSNLMYGRGCYFCGIEKLKKKATSSTQHFKDRVFNINKDVEIISEYTGLHDNITFLCKKCGRTGITKAYNLTSRTIGCYRCSNSLGENKISKLLYDWGYEYIGQYKFSDCKDVRPLPFNFYLPDFNICIEYDGAQHYEPKFLTLEAFDKLVKHDNIKNTYCTKNNIPLIRIPYWKDIDGDLEYYLFDKLHEFNAIIDLKQ